MRMRVCLATLSATLLACGDGSERVERSDAAAADTAGRVVAGEVNGCAGSRTDSTRSSGGRSDTVRAIPVNRGSHGMIARTRWIASPDGCAILVVEDPASIEADPLPNAALLVSEREERPLVMAMESVWDVAPDSAWRTLAIGRGWLLMGAGEDTIPPARWAALARETGRSAEELAANAFNASGMGYARGVAITSLQSIAAGGASRTIGFGGWRVRWRGDTLFVGGAPEHARDGAEPTRWTIHTAPDWQWVAVPAAYAPAPERWAEGPEIQLGVEQDSIFGGMGVVNLAFGRTVQSLAGQVTLNAPDRPPRVVGPGVVLAATLGGRFIVAIRPRPRARAIDPKLELVVYEVP